MTAKVLLPVPPFSKRYHTQLIQFYRTVYQAIFKRYPKFDGKLREFSPKQGAFWYWLELGCKAIVFLCALALTLVLMGLGAIAFFFLLLLILCGPLIVAITAFKAGV